MCQLYGPFFHLHSKIGTDKQMLGFVSQERSQKVSFFAFGADLTFCKLHIVIY